MFNGESRRKLAIHGPVIDLDCPIPALNDSLDALLGRFEVPGWPESFQPVTGTIHPYNEAEVLPRLPESARHTSRTPDMIDVYEEGDRCWVVDDRWGIAEIDFPRASWRSWIVPQPKVDPYRLAELAVVWPMSQLLEPRGLHLIPAISAVRDGFAVMILCPFGIEPELTAMILNGYKLIGQRWTALREEDGRIAMLHIPGRIERFTTPRLRFNNEEQESWLDLTQEYPGSWQNHAFCDAVVIAEPGRRQKAQLRPTDSADAAILLRDAWPISELTPARRGASLPGLLAKECRCYEVQLSRSTKDLLGLLNSIRYANTASDEQSAAA